MESWAVMDPIHICFCLKSSMVSLGSEENLEACYKSLYKRIPKFLKDNPSFKMAFSFNGIIFDFFHERHPEFITFLNECISKGQVELLGGGCYDPAFPLLFPRDRQGQIELLSSKIRQNTGKRPRGLSICASIWDVSLVNTFDTCGMEYIMLDESLIPPEKTKYIPFIMFDKNKEISIIPFYRGEKPSPENPIGFLEKLYAAVKKDKSKSPIQSNGTRGAAFQFSHEEFTTLLDSGALNIISNEISKNESGFIMSTPYQFLKSDNIRTPVYISARMSCDIEQWAVRPYEQVRIGRHYPLTIYDFFQLYPQSKALYDRMLYVGILLNQSHGDKIRKKVAREKLWEAQNGDGFICTAKGAFAGTAYRQLAYKNINEVEQILRECGNFKESVSAYDYNGDGLNEYVCRMNSYFACINLIGGAITEFDLMKNSGNYADNFTRVAKFEGCDDGYQRGFFVDHLFTEREFENYLESKPSGNVVFSKILYIEKKFSITRKEIVLEASALYKNRQKINLTKRYILVSDGMMVQYILKNDSDTPLSAKFAVESSFAQINFNSLGFNAFKLEIISDGQKREIDTKSSSKSVNSDGKLTNVDDFLLTDTDNGISFLFEPNESSGLAFEPILFRRPEYASGEIVDAGMTFSGTIFWDLNIEPGKEIEKTINFSVFNEHKSKKTHKNIPAEN